MFINKVLKSIKYRLNLLINRIKYDINYKGIRNNNPVVLTPLETINLILKDHCSISRFGDGEFYLMLGLNYSPFQECTPELTKDLLEVIKSRSKGLLIGLPDTFNEVKRYEKSSRKFWKSFMGQYRDRIIACLPSNFKDIIYGNTNSTRFYSDILDKSSAKPIIEGFKKIFSNRDIIIIEGEKSRLGVGNDLFDSAHSIRRILVPARNAYFVTTDVLSFVTNNIPNNDNILIVIAAGMAATIWAYRLHNMGYQALDLGHIDIQYEYYLRKAENKIAIPGKYTNEAKNGRNPDDSILDNFFFNQIIFEVNYDDKYDKKINKV